MTVRGWCRTARAGVFAAVCVLLAALGHAAMSASAVPWWAVAAGVIVTGLAGWLLAGRERGRTLIVTVVTAAQAVLHETFSWARSSASGPTAMSHPGPSAATSARDVGPMSSMDMGAVGGTDIGSAGHTVHDIAGLGHPYGMADASDAASFGMFAAHLLAALLCGLWLAYGERAVFRVLRATAAWLAAPLRLLVTPLTPFRRPETHRRRAVAAPAPVCLLLCCSLTFRGPPVGAAVL
ncbi:hypothetical protein [Streptomyces sp. NPDC088816]|uniref:hypothetical protein n=1 Tax=Streptomyces sp. NPDC088816 TaxID=3365906 RepID=UPI00382174B3